MRKRNGERQAFDRAKLRSGLGRAAHKRPVSASAIDAIVARIVSTAEEAGGELGARRIGEMCLEALRGLDRVAYLQFAAVYREFADIDEVQLELARLRGEPPASEPRRSTPSSHFAKTGGADSVRGNEDPAQLPPKAR